MRVRKRTLALSYLGGTGLGIGAILLAVGVFRLGTDVGTAIGVLSGTIPAGSLASARYWLPRTRLDDEQLWRVAVWGALGIAAVAVLDVAAVAVHYAVEPVGGVVLTVLLSNVAAGGVAGVLLGVLREHARTARRLHRKNAVLNRVLRHDLRNTAGIVRAHAETIRDEDDVDREARLDAIADAVDRLVDLSEAARRIERTLDGRAETRRLDAVPVVERRIERARRDHPEATIEASLPDAAWIRAGDELPTVVDELLGNALEHAGPSPTVRISLSAGSDGTVTFRVADDGPGLPDTEQVVAEPREETPLDHSAGVGLWLVRWLVEGYGGSIAFDRSREGGTAVTVSFPGAGRG